MPDSSFWDRLKQRKLFQWALAYAAGAWALLEGVDLVGGQFDWPRWLLQSITILVAVGFVVVLVLAWYHGEKGQQKVTGRELLILAGVLASGAGLLAFLVDPASAPDEPVVEAAAGERVPLILADFEDHTLDARLGELTTDVLRIELGRSDGIALVGSEELETALLRMELDPSTPLTREVAVEIAQRRGVPLVVAGRIDALGGAIQFLAELIRPVEDAPGGGHRTVANDSTEILHAIGELGRGLREDAGEASGSVAESAPLPGVTTASLEALRLYARARVLIYEEAAFDRAVELLDRAVEVDSSFAEGYRLLGAALQNAGAPRTRIIESRRKAYLLRDRLPEGQQLSVEFDYHRGVTGDLGAVLAAARRTDRFGPLTVVYREMGLHERAATVHRRQLEGGEIPPGGLATLHNAFNQFVIVGDFEGAERTLSVMVQQNPDSWVVPWDRARLAIAQRDYTGAERHLSTLADVARTNANARQFLLETRRGLFWRRGQAARALGQLEEQRTRWLEEGREGEAWVEVARVVRLHANLLGEQATAAAVLEQARAAHPTESIEPWDVPYPLLIEAYALAGRPDLSRLTLLEYERRVASDERGSPYGKPGLMERVMSQVALAEGDIEEAVRLLRRGLELYCHPALCAVLMAQAHDTAVRADSALVWYERYLETPRTLEMDAEHLASALERLAQLHDEQGDVGGAEELYARFIDLWEEADAELQPRVEAAKARLGR